MGFPDEDVSCSIINEHSVNRDDALNSPYLLDLDFLDSLMLSQT